MARLGEMIHIFVLILAVCGSTHGITINQGGRVRYTRQGEVDQKCPPLTLREEEDVSVQSTKRWSVMDRLSFSFGDWEQTDLAPGAAPIIPFTPSDPSTLPATAQLASFRVLDVGRNHDRGVRQVSGILELRILDTKHGRPRQKFLRQARFDQMPGSSVLYIEVEGIYEQAENEDVVCLLGCTYLPSSSSSPSPKSKDCDIMVQIHYPLTFNLTSRVIRGTIQSLADPGTSSDFSVVSFSSQLSNLDIYEATAGNLVNSACNNISLESAVVENAFKANVSDFCMIAQAYMTSSWSPLKIVPNWRCNGTSDYCGKVGPFSNFTARTALQVDYNTSRVEIVIQDFRSTCFTTSDQEGIGEVPVSFVLRLVPADEDMSVARDRSALDGQTLVAEGTWKNGNDTLCMVACKLDDESGLADACIARICLQIPLTLSIMRRNIFQGRISSLLPDGDKNAFYPIDVYTELQFNRHFPPAFSKALSYNFSMLDFAGAVMTRNEPNQGYSRMKAPWSKFPSLAGDEESHYMSLAEDLSVQNGLKMSKGMLFSELNFEVIALDSYLPFLWTGFTEVTEGGDLSVSGNDTIVTETSTAVTHRRQEGRETLNCSGTIVFARYESQVISPPLTIFVEGYYKPAGGKMYMVGCRHIEGTWQNIFENSFDLNEGMDCEIEIVLHYPTTFSAWLLNPGMKVQVHSNRPVDDIFHFPDIEAETNPIYYKKERESILSAKSVEAALSILTLSLMVLCIFGQLSYLGSHMESTPYVSLLMVGVQAMGYALPLVTSAESLLLRKFDYRRNYFFEVSGSTQMIIYADKVFTLVALLFLLRLFEMVWRERTQLEDLQLESVSVPREPIVVVSCLIIHAVGFISVMALHSRNHSGNGNTTWNGDFPSPLAKETVPGNRTGTVWFDMSGGGVLNKGLQEYAGLVEDLFLLPQAIGFTMWDVRGKPLRFSFFAGLTVLQIVPHVYDYVRGIGLNGYAYPLYADPNFDFYTSVGNILIPVLALLLAILVYCQQRWNGVMRFPSRFLYQRLGTKNSETELMTTNGRGHLPPIPEDE